LQKNCENDIKKHPENTNKNTVKTPREKLLKSPFIKNLARNHPKHLVVTLFDVSTKSFLYKKL
jgi:uracil-DNA glycosylase